MKTALIGVGFLGTHVASELLQAGCEVVAFDVAAEASELRLRAEGIPMQVLPLDVRDALAVVQAMETSRPEAIINTTIASNRGLRPAMVTQVNVMGLVHLLEAARLFNVRRVVQASSAVVYGGVLRTGQIRAPQPESPVFMAPNSFYGVTKQAAEFIGHAYGLHCGLEFVAIRFPHVFGGGSTSPGYAMEQLVTAAVAGKQVVIDRPELTWQGREDFIYVRDAAWSLVLAARAPMPEQYAMHVSTGVHCTFDEAVDLVRRVVGRLDMVQGLPADARSPHLGLPLDGRLDGALAKRQIGFAPRFTLEAAVADYARRLRGQPARSTS